VAPSDVPVSPSSASFFPNSSSHRRRRSHGQLNAASDRPQLDTNDRPPPSPLEAIDEWDRAQDRDRDHYDPFSKSPASRKMADGRTPSPSEENGGFGQENGKTGQRKTYGVVETNGPTWAGAQERSARVNGAARAKQDGGFFGRHLRSLSTSLPRFQMGDDKNYSEKEKLGRGRSPGVLGGIKHLAGLGWRLRLPLLVVALVLVMIGMFFATREYAFVRIRS